MAYVHKKTQMINAIKEASLTETTFDKGDVESIMIYLTGMAKTYLFKTTVEVVKDNTEITLSGFRNEDDFLDMQAYVSDDKIKFKPKFFDFEIDDKLMTLTIIVK
jgi:hypothetical protein